MATAPLRSHHTCWRDAATSDVQMDLGKNADVGSSGLCGPAPPMGRDVDYPAGSADPRTAFLLGVLRDIMNPLKNARGHPTCEALHRGMWEQGCRTGKEASHTTG